MLNYFDGSGPTGHLQATLIVRFLILSDHMFDLDLVCALSLCTFVGSCFIQKKNYNHQVCSLHCYRYLPCPRHRKHQRPLYIIFLLPRLEIILPHSTFLHCLNTTTFLFLLIQMQNTTIQMLLMTLVVFVTCVLTDESTTLVPWRCYPIMRLSFVRDVALDAMLVHPSLEQNAATASVPVHKI